MANPIQKGRIKNVQVGSRVSGHKRNGEIKPSTGNLIDVKFVTDLPVSLGDHVLFRKIRDGNTAEIVEITREAK